MRVVGPRELVYLLLDRFGSISVGLIRRYAVEHLDDYYVPGTFIPITANGSLSYRCIEDTLLDMSYSGEIIIKNGVVTLGTKCE